MRSAAALALAALRRSFAADAASASTTAPPRPKAVLRSILTDASAPLTSAAVWESAKVRKERG